VCVLSRVQLCDLRDCSPPVSSVHEIFQAGILEWIAISFSRGSSQPRDWTHVSCISWVGRKRHTKSEKKKKKAEFEETEQAQEPESDKAEKLELSGQNFSNYY